MTDNLTDRQRALIGQVQAGEIIERAPDTEEQLLGLARQGHLRADWNEGQWHFYSDAAPEETPETTPEDQAE